MVALIEDQMLAFLVSEEEQRCQDLEEAKGKKVKRRKIEKAWRRGAHPRLCQDPDFLLMVSEYDYDLDDTGFREYCQGRGVLNVAGDPESERWRVFHNPVIDRDGFLENRHF